MAVFDTAEEVRALAPPLTLLADDNDRRGLIMTGAGIPEDPVTGSASGGMAAYLWKYGLLRERCYTVEQGHLVGRPGIVEVEVDADGDKPTRVRIAGTAVT
ncbi:MAG: PhzF family phenazine biosynthesis protein, partial [Alphaproteobacteria bacterium]